MLYLNQQPVKREDLPTEFERLRSEKGIEEIVIDADGRLQLKDAMVLVEVAERAGLRAMIGARAPLEPGEALEEAPPAEEVEGGE